MIIKAENLQMVYSTSKKEIFSNLNLDISENQTVSIFGDSGSGKSTIGQILCGIVKPTQGSIYYNNNKLTYPFQKKYRKDIQILFQHPEVSFNPKIKIINSLKEIYKLYKLDYSNDKLCGYLKDFGIYSEHLNRYPSELSGGELQRIALARIIIINPKFIVLDEPTSMLDVISQAQMINLLKQIQQKTKVSYLFISHDYMLCENFSDVIYFLNNGVLTKKSHILNGEKI